MNEAIGNSFVLGVVLFFVAVFGVFFATSTAYTKAFKVKNKIVELIEKYDDILGVDAATGTKLDGNLEQEINTILGEIGYRVSTGVNYNCPVRNGQDALYKGTNYAYCIYKYQTVKGYYYGVATYMYFQIPVIGVELKFPVYGETKISRILGIGATK